MQEVVQALPSEWARRGRRALRGISISPTVSWSVHDGSPLTSTSRRLIILGSQVAAYLARSLTRPTNQLPRYEIAREVARLWETVREWDEDAALRASYVTLVAASSGDLAWTDGPELAERLALATTLVGAAESASPGWKLLRDQGLAIAERHGFDLATASANAAFWPELRQGFTIDEVEDVLAVVPAVGPLPELEGPLDRGIAPDRLEMRESATTRHPAPVRRLRDTPVRLSPEPLALVDQPAGDDTEVALTPTGPADRRQVRVWFATNRAPASSGWFGSDPDAVRYGTIDFSIDADAVRDVRHSRAATPRERFTSSAQSLVGLDEAAFFDGLRVGGEPGVLLFIHGYNNRFDQAMQRAAQLSWDLALDTPVVAFSWPSFGNVLRYRYDQEMVSATQRAFADFLLRLADVAEVDVLVHSMGNRLLSTAADTFARLWPRGQKLRSLALAAADLGVPTYGETAQLYARHLSAKAVSYVAADDYALWISSRLNQVDIVGLGGPGTDIPPIRVFDAYEFSQTDQPLRHTYFAKSAEVLIDLADLLHRA